MKCESQWCRQSDAQSAGAGIVDGYWEYRLKPWDVAAGVLIAEEAGALVTTMGGEPFSVRGMASCLFLGFLPYFRGGQRARDYHGRRALLGMRPGELPSLQPAHAWCTAYLTTLSCMHVTMCSRSSAQVLLHIPEQVCTMCVKCSRCNLALSCQAAWPEPEPYPKP